MAGLVPWATNRSDPTSASGSVPNQNRIDQAENGRVRTNAEREGQNRGGRKSRCSGHQPPGVANILSQLVEESDSSCLPAVVLGGVDSAKLQSGAPPRFGARQTAALEVVGAQLQVELHFLTHLPFEPIPSHQNVDERPKSRPHDYTSSGVAFNAVPIAEASRFHSAVSSRNRRRPAAVKV